MARSRGVELLAAISLCTALPLPLAAQGGWRSWDLVMGIGLDSIAYIKFADRSAVDAA
jgi:hypothetical protein